MSERSYSVYLVETGDSGGERQVTSPVTGVELDFYDSGVWLDRETGRNFFPYEQIRTIREHTADQGPDPRDREGSGDDAKGESGAEADH